MPPLTLVVAQSGTTRQEGRRHVSDRDYGVGSVELGIDRGVNRQMVIRFERAGSRVHVVQQNLSHRALEGHPELVRNVRESFAASILAALPLEGEEGSRILVDATPFSSVTGPIWLVVYATGIREASGSIAIAARSTESGCKLFPENRITRSRSP